MSKRICRQVFVIVLLRSLLPLVGAKVAAAADQDEGLKFDTEAQWTYDNNLFRLPTTYQNLDGLIGPGAGREDSFTSLIAGVDGHWYVGRQTLQLSGQFQDDIYAKNEFLNNHSGKARLEWDWVVNSALDGKLGGDYTRSLAGFEDNRVLQPDMVQSADYFGELTYHLGSEWRLKLTDHESKVEHDLAVQQLNDFNGTEVTGGLEFQTSTDLIVGGIFRYSGGSYPNAPQVPAPGVLEGYQGYQNYHDYNPMVTAIYPIDSKLRFDAAVGFIRREYSVAPDSDFSGSTWRANIQWTPTAKIQAAILGWRELRAYLDVESDYYVSTGEGVRVTWLPTAKLQFTLQPSHEAQHYLLTSQSVLIFDARQDQLNKLTLTADYNPRRWLDVTASYKLEHRNSNVSIWRYDDTIANIGVKITF